MCVCVCVKHTLSPHLLLMSSLFLFSHQLMFHFTLRTEMKTWIICWNASAFVSVTNKFRLVRCYISLKIWCCLFYRIMLCKISSLGIKMDNSYLNINQKVAKQKWLFVFYAFLQIDILIMPFIDDGNID